MASRFIAPLFDAGNGISPSDGAKLTFFITGTSTLKDTFSDEAATTPNTNPVVSDGDGLFPEIWITGTYKVTLTDKNNKPKWEEDPVISGLTISDDDARYSAVFGSIASMLTLTTADGNAYVAVSGQSVYLTSYYASIPFSEAQGGGGHFRVMTLAEYALTPDELGLAFTVGSFAFVREQDGSTLYMSQFGFSPSNSAADNTAIAESVANDIAVDNATLFFDQGSDSVCDVNPIEITTFVNIDGDFPEIRCLTGSAFYYSTSGIGRVSVGGINLRGDTDSAQRINHTPGTPQGSDVTIFSEHEWNAGTELDTATGFTNTYEVNADPTTVAAGIHCRSGRFTLGDKVKIEGFETGVYLEGTSVVKISNNVLVQFCQVGMQTRADRDNSALKCTLFEISKATFWFCFVGAYQNELQDSVYEGSYLNRCCIPTVSRNTTNIKHNKGYFESNHNSIDIDGAFQKNEVYTDCIWTQVHETADFVKLLGGASSDNNNQEVVFVRPDIKFIGQVQLTVGGTPGRLSRLIFDKRYPYLPESVTWLFIQNERNQGIMLDPKFTRGLFNITAGSSVSLAVVKDTGNPNNGNYLEITGDGVGADFNGVSVNVAPSLLAPVNQVQDVNISYEFQYDDSGSGDSIAEPFGMYAGARRSPVQNLTVTNNPVPDGQWFKAEYSYKTSSGFSATAFSGGFTGVLRIRNFNVSYGGGHAENYDPTPHQQTSIGVPTNGDFIAGDEVAFRGGSSTNRGAVCSVSGSPGTWREFGAYV